MGKMIVVLVILIVVVVGAILLVTLWPSEEDRMRRRANRRSIVIEDATVNAAADNYQLLRRFNSFVEQQLHQDATLPFMTAAERQRAQALVDEFTEDRRDK